MTYSQLALGSFVNVLRVVWCIEIINWFWVQTSIWISDTVTAGSLGRPWRDFAVYTLWNALRSNTVKPTDGMPEIFTFYVVKWYTWNVCHFFPNDNKYFHRRTYYELTLLGWFYSWQAWHGTVRILECTAKRYIFITWRICLSWYKHYRLPHTWYIDWRSYSYRHITHW